MKLNRHIACGFMALAAIGAGTWAARADEADFYRGKSVNMLIGYSAGGGYDIYARTLARHMARHIPGNPTIVAQNMPGAGSQKAMVYLLDVAAKDGLTFGSPSVGSSGHVSTELFKLQAGVSAVHVPYKGSSPMLVDLMSGNTDFTIDQISSAIGFIQGGKIKALAVTSRTRSAQLPDVPTLREAGFPDYEVSVWFCVAAPAGTPEDRIQALNAALNKVLAEPAVRERLASLGAQPLGGPAQDLARQILTEEKNIQAVTKVVSFDN